MANVLKASVDFNTSTAERKLKRLADQVQKVNRAATSGSSSSLASGLRKASSTTDTIVNKTRLWEKGVNSVKRALNGVNKDARESSNIFSGIIKRLSGIGGAIFGIMGARAGLNASDTITSAENKFNTINGGNTDLTQTQLDKIYGAAQRSRSNYGDMMGNVAKSMTLAPDAFQGNVDAAIKFQEIMGKAYVLGGASAAEQSSSMYQMIQALGSGRLQGDELRSVTEGAPLAAKAIEKYAQSIYNTNDALKDMGSQGLITSELVTAAILNSGEDIQKQFETTQITFSQVWTKIKNMALKAFEPVQDKLKEMLTNFTKNGGIEKIGSMLAKIGTIMRNVLTFAQNVYQFISDNWSKIQPIISGIFKALIVGITAYTLVSLEAAILTTAAWIKAHWPILVLVGLIYLLMTNIRNLGEFFNTVLNAMFVVAVALAFGMLMIAAITANGINGMIFSTAMFAKIAFFGVFSAIMLILQELTGGFKTTAEAIGAICLALAIAIVVYAAIASSGITLILGLIVAAILAVAGLFFMFAEEVMGGLAGIGSVAEAIVTNIQAGWRIMLSSMAMAFWKWVDGILKDCEPLINLINSLSSTFGGGTIDVNFAANKASANWEVIQNEKSRVKSLGEAWNTGYAEGAAVGRGIENWINEKGEAIKDALDINSKLDGVKSDLEQQSADLDAKLKATEDNLNAEVEKGNQQLGDIGKSGGSTAGNTSKIADSMDLAEEDLEYLKQIAQMEWKKEFTTATIKVDMSNYNTISGDTDLDGIVTRLTDKLYEELDSVANGVYAY